MIFARIQQSKVFAALLCASLLGAFLLVSTRTMLGDTYQAAPAGAEQAIKTAERQWADALSTGDTTVVEPLLASDLTGIDPTGKGFDKAGMLSLLRDGPNLFVSNRINSIQVSVHGDTAVAQGDETWEMRVGDVKHGRFLFTDTWMRRDGKWQVVASHSSMAPQ